MDGWVIKDVKEVETGKIVSQDILEGDIEISHMSSDKYFGQV